jgi:hemerythrin
MNQAILALVKWFQHHILTHDTKASKWHQKGKYMLLIDK